jgi:hypothetical protein
MGRVWASAVGKSEGGSQGGLDGDEPGEAEVVGSGVHVGKGEQISVAFVKQSKSFLLSSVSKSWRLDESKDTVVNRSSTTTWGSSR